MIARLVAVLCLAPVAALAEDGGGVLRCTAEVAGITACFGGKLCQCGLGRGGSMTGLVEGWRWDCGILRPYCPAAPESAAVPEPLPFEVEIQVPGRFGRRR